MFKLNDPMVSRRSLKHGRIVRIKDKEFECEMVEAYNIEGKWRDGCRFWFTEQAMLHPYEVTPDMVPNDTWAGKPVRDYERKDNPRQ